MGRVYNVIDADGHILEPLDLWDKYIDPAFRDRAPRIVKQENGKERLVIEEQRRQMQNELALMGQLQDLAGNALGKQEGADENRGINDGAYWHRSFWLRPRQPEFRLPVRG